jgi:hypothetical protein
MTPSRSGQGYRVTFPDEERLSEDLKREVLPDVVRVVGERVLAETPQGATGNLRKGIQAGMEQGGSAGFVASTAPHTHMIIKGVTPHKTSVYEGRGGKPKAAKRRALKLPGGVLRASAWHPGQGADPFMDRGVNASRQDVAGILQDAQPLLDKVVRKLTGG